MTFNPAGFRVTVEFTSDWLIGTGAGRHGGLDKVCARDVDGFPHLPSSSVTGVLAAAAEDALDALVAQGGETWREWYTWLFGSRPSRATADSWRAAIPRPVPAALQPGAFSLEDSTRLAILAQPTTGTPGVQLSRQQVLEALFTARPGVAMTGSGTSVGTAVDDTLRFEERAARGLVFCATWSLKGTHADEDLWPAELLLRLGADLQNGLGAKRTRGAGQAAISFDGVRATAALLDLASGKDLPGPPQPADTALPTGGTKPDDRPLVPVARLVLDFKLPVIVEDEKAGAQGSLPGTMLLGAVHRELAAQGLDAATFVKDGRMVVTDAFPTHPGSDERPHVWPFHWLMSKDESGGDTLNIVEHSKGHENNPRLRTSPGRFVLPTNSGLNAVSLARTEHIHAVNDPAKRRPTKSSGGVYSWSAIDAGTRLVAELWLPEGTTFDLPTTPSSLKIGRARKGDTGDVLLAWVQPPSLPDPPNLLKGKEMLIRCESDVLLYNERGRPTPTRGLLIEVLRAALDDNQLALASPEHASDSISEKSGVVARVRHGWQEAWGLPRPPLPVIGAGSFIVLVPSKDLDATAVADVLADGLGRRRAEGFGRVSLHDAEMLPTNTTIVPVAASSSGSVPEDGSSAEVHGEIESPVPERILHRAWLRACEEQIVVKAQDPEWRGRVVAKMTPTQRGRLRHYVQTGRPDLAGLRVDDVWQTIFEAERPAAVEAVAKALPALVVTECVRAETHAQRMKDRKLAESGKADA